MTVTVTETLAESASHGELPILGCADRDSEPAAGLPASAPWNLKHVQDFKSTRKQLELVPSRVPPGQVRVGLARAQPQRGLAAGAALALNQ
jgi:hypothetical protein